MGEYISFWWSKFIVDVSIYTGIFLLIFIYAAIRTVKDLMRQSRCKHERYYETSACDAVCKRCGKNLGFIGTVREKKQQ